VLIILLPTAWLAIVTFFVAICQIAARGDAIVAPSATRKDGRLLRAGVRVWDDALAGRDAITTACVSSRATTTRSAARANALHRRRPRSRAGS
jgi:hypothetical protein